MRPPSFEERQAQRIHQQKIQAARPTVPTAGSGLRSGSAQGRLAGPSPEGPLRGRPPAREDGTPNSGRPPAGAVRRPSQGREVRAQSSQSASRPRPPPDPATSQIHAFLKVYGMQQYARRIIELGINDLEQVSRLTDGDMIALLEQLRILPGHRLKLMQAIDSLRAGASSSAQNQLSQDDMAFIERLSQENRALVEERERAGQKVADAQTQTRRLEAICRAQAQQIEGYRAQVRELEEIAQERTEQVQFLLWQLQQVVAAQPGMEESVYRSYDDWGSETAKMKSSMGGDLRASHNVSIPFSDDGVRLGEPTTGVDDAALAAAPTPLLSRHRANPPSGCEPEGEDAVSEVLALSGQERASAGSRFDADVFDVDRQELVSRASRSKQAKPSALRDPVGVGARQLVDWGVPAGQPQSHKPGVAQSLDSAKIQECLAGFDVDRVVRCLAMAVQTHIIMALKASRPHRCTSESVLEKCTIFLEPEALKTLQQRAIEAPPENLNNSLKSTCSVFNSVSGLRPGTAASLIHPLNDVANRGIVSLWTLYTFLRNVMVAFRFQPEVTVVSLFYLERFMDKAGVAVTPDNWQRVCITAMMLASKVWDDESYENYDFATLCPLYELDEINAFERTFLQVIAYDVSVKGSEYAKTYFVLRTLGSMAGSTNADFLPPLDEKKSKRLQERCLEKQVEFRERCIREVGEVPDLLNMTL
mmetsp:Transcript_60259/g.161695  ORF Transcript_60259/g.161695 Transcript_60259/m.161695 type:complete len:703 (+) Transcript_60259:51-2159(+)